MHLFEIVRDRLGLQPIVILDDVFAQLDDSRRTQILDFARKQDQVLITVAAEGDVPTMNRPIASTWPHWTNQLP